MSEKRENSQEVEILPVQEQPPVPAPFRPATAARENGGIICDMDEGPCACGAWH